jgi:isoleucyl-tRNA synthetase
VVLLRQPGPLDSIIYSEQAIKDSIPEFLLPLWNVFSFFVIYANIDRIRSRRRSGGDAGQLGPETLAAPPVIARWAPGRKSIGG